MNKKGKNFTFSVNLWGNNYMNFGPQHHTYQLKNFKIGEKLSPFSFSNPWCCRAHQPTPAGFIPQLMHAKRKRFRFEAVSCLKLALNTTPINLEISKLVKNCLPFSFSNPWCCRAHQHNPAGFIHQLLHAKRKRKQCRPVLNLVRWLLHLISLIFDVTILLYSSHPLTSKFAFYMTSFYEATIFFQFWVHIFSLWGLHFIQELPSVPQHAGGQRDLLADPLRQDGVLQE